MKKVFNLARTKRELIAVFTLAFLITFLIASAGAFVFIVGYYKAPTATSTLPLWEQGKMVMLFGLINLAIYVYLFFRFRGMIKRLERPES